MLVQINMFLTKSCKCFLIHKFIHQVDIPRVGALVETLLLSTLNIQVLIDFSLTVNAITLILISGRGSAILSAEEGKSGFI